MTSIELPPTLLKRARLESTRRGLTFRAFVEQALRAALVRKETPR